MMRWVIALLLSGYISSVWAFDLSPARFEHLSVEDGLSQSSVLSICQDAQGFLWFGTYEGLDRYDGYQFKIYYHDDQDSTSLSQNVVRVIVVDSSGTLWVGTEGGLNRYDSEKDQFIRYTHDPDNPNSLAHNRIRNIYSDPSGSLWISTDDGLSQYDSDKNCFVNYHHSTDNPSSLTNSRVRCTFRDSQGRFWVGTDEGLNLLDDKTNRFIHFVHDPDNPESISDDLVVEIFEDKTQQLWLGTWGGGLCRFDPATQGFIRYQPRPEDENSLSHTIVRTIYEDTQGNLWIGTYGGGLNLYDRSADHFIRIQKMSDNSRGLSSNAIFKIFEDRSGILWIGTEFGGVNKLDERKTQFDNYLTDTDDVKAVPNNTINSIAIDPDFGDRVLWIGTWGNGLVQFEMGGHIKLYRHEPENPNSICSDIVRWIHPGQQGQLWIGTEEGLSCFNRQSKTFENYPFQLSNELEMDYDNVFSVIEDYQGGIWVGSYYGGLHRFDRKYKKFIRYPARTDDPATVNDYIVWTLYEDSRHDLWIGTETGGLNRYRPEDGQFKSYQKKPDDPFSISSNKVLCILEDSRGFLWLGTPAGLNRMNRDTEAFTHYTSLDGLPANAVQGILEDNQGCLWISTTWGISRFDPESETFLNFTMDDGLPCNEYYVNACCKGPDGRLYFGGINGFTTFDPQKIQINTHIPPVVITDFKIYNESIPIGLWKKDRRILKKNILETKCITLKHYENVISFDFTALDFSSPGKNCYAYMLADLETEWNYVGQRHYATYSQLPPGEYVFLVKGTNNNKIWNEEGTSLQILIKPALWNTTLFRVFIILLIIIASLVVHRLRIRTIHSRNLQLQEMNKKLNREVEERRSAEARLQSSVKEKEVLMKEIHHRVKNNMQIICSLLSLQSNRIQDPELLRLFTESQNRVRAMALIHERLYKTKDLHRINFKIYLQDLVKDLLAVYLGNSQEVRMDLDIGPIHLPVNQAVPCGLIINELVSNAIKYAFPKKRDIQNNIFIKMEKQNGHILMSVRDNGIGLPGTVVEYQKESLGLKLVDILVQQQLHGNLTWKVNGGTCFQVQFDENS
jgi:two-component sensor histidine kinase/ligand-binding sensor domain-containing protein